MRRSALLLVVSCGLAGVLGGLHGAGAVPDPLSAVTVSADVAAKPTVEFEKPFAVAKTSNKVVAAGSGDVLAKGQTIVFDYVLVDGRTGEEVQTSFGQTPASLVLDKKQTATQLVNSLKGKTVGSRVLVAIAPKDGLAERLNVTTVKKRDTLLFVIDVKSARKPLTRATGEAVAPVGGLPAVALAANGKPKITIPTGVAAPPTLVSQVLIKGTGPVVTAGQTVTVHYTGVIWATGKQVDSSWDRGAPLDTMIGTGSVIAGWDEGVVGQTVGSQVLLVVPPDKGDSRQGTDTIVFVIDILSAS
jgi:peptidylprolyl isomerase